MASNFLDDVQARFPRLFSVVDDGVLRADLDRATQRVGGADAAAFHHLCADYEFRSLFKAYHLTFTLIMSGREGVPDIAGKAEQDVAAIQSAATLQEMRNAYRAKLLNDRQFDDTLCELAIGAVCGRVFDPGSLKLEHPIGTKAINSDFYGHFAGQSVRVEVRRIAPAWPPKAPPEVKEALDQFDFPTGVSALLTGRVRTMEDVRLIRERLRYIFEHRNSVDPQWGGELPDGTWINREPQAGDEDHWELGEGLVASVSFHPEEPDLRLIVESAVTRATMSAEEREELLAMNPPGVIAYSPTPGPTHREVPASRSIWDGVNEKLRQCEPGVVNIVALGLGLGLDKEDLADAMFGTSFIARDRESEGGYVARLDNGPFSPSGGDPLFAKMSLVMGFKLNMQPPLLKLVPNGHAAVPVPPELIERLAQESKRRFIR